MFACNHDSPPEERWFINTLIEVTTQLTNLAFAEGVFLRIPPWDSSPLNHHLGVYFLEHQTSKVFGEEFYLLVMVGDGWWDL